MAKKKTEQERMAEAKAARGVKAHEPTPEDLASRVEYDRTTRRELEAAERERPPGHVRRREAEQGGAE